MTNIESAYINECLQKYNNIPLDSNGNKDWTKAIPFYFDIQQKVGIRKLNEFICCLDSLNKGERKMKNNKIGIKVDVVTVDLRCKHCECSMPELVSKYYKSFRKENDKYVKGDFEITREIVTEETVCPYCGSNLFDTTLGLKINTSYISE